MAVIRRRYVPDNTSMARFLTSNRVKDVVVNAAEDIVGDARTAARRHDTSQNYQIVARFGAKRAEGGIRRVAWIFNEDEDSVIAEFGDKEKDRPELRILRSAAEPYHVPQGVRRRGGKS
jgi:hypothetical protein